MSRNLVERLARRAAGGDLASARSLVRILENQGVPEPEGLPPGTFERLAAVAENVANAISHRSFPGSYMGDLDLVAQILRGMAPGEKAPEPLERPLTIDAMRAAPDGSVRGVVAISLTDVIDGDYEAFLDALSRRLVGSTLLNDVSHRLVGARRGNEILVEVSGDASLVLDTLDHDDQDDDENQD